MDRRRARFVPNSLLVTLGWAVVSTAVACGLCMTSLLHGVTEPFFGFVERLFYVAMLAWFIVVAIYLV